VSVVDVAGRRVARTIADVAARPWGLAASADGARLWVAGGPSGDVAVVDATRGVVTKRIAAGGSPWGVAVGPEVRP
jgi:YVTN family beta-propeller protein